MALILSLCICNIHSLLSLTSVADILVFAACEVTLVLQTMFFSSARIGMAMTSSVYFVAAVAFGSPVIVGTAVMTSLGLFPIVWFTQREYSKTAWIVSVQEAIPAMCGLEVFHVIENSLGKHGPIMAVSYFAYWVATIGSNFVVNGTLRWYLHRPTLKQLVDPGMLRMAALLVLVIDILAGIMMLFGLRVTGIVGVLIVCAALLLVSQLCKWLLDAMDQASRDDLTGLYNRRHFSQTLRKRLRQTPLAITIIDIDHFKQYNDTYGHPEGDKLLKELASILMQQCSNGSIACRYGGEEFMILVLNKTHDSAYQWVDELRQKISSHSFTQVGVNVTISAGIALYPDDAETHEELVRRADAALYEAKASGRNCVRLYGPSMKMA